MGIQKDLATGYAGEKIAISLFTKAGIKAEQQTVKRGRFPDYDLQCSYLTQDFTAEVKYDIYAVKSGNIAIEMLNPKTGKFSGLMATKADLWVHITDDTYVANAEALKRWVNNNIPKRVISAGGDGNATLYLYDKDTIFHAPLFTKIDHLPAIARRTAILEHVTT